eukprot:13797327-Ditylum_brightwellii.AAC.1
MFGVKGGKEAGNAEPAFGGRREAQGGQIKIAELAFGGGNSRGSGGVLHQKQNRSISFLRQ